MLKMKCTVCEEEISSQLLAEIDQIDCPHCLQQVPVVDVIIHAQGYSYHRDDLIKRLFRYKTLLAEVSKERDLLENSPEASPESKNSLERFMATLEEMMAGARTNLRIEFETPLEINYQIHRSSNSGLLSNLSMQGARIELSPDKPLPRSKAPISLSVSLAGRDEVLSLTGTVAWAKKGTKKQLNSQVGVNFAYLNKEVQTSLWAFISHSAS